MGLFDDGVVLVGIDGTRRQACGLWLDDVVSDIGGVDRPLPDRWERPRSQPCSASAVTRVDWSAFRVQMAPIALSRHKAEEPQNRKTPCKTGETRASLAAVRLKCGRTPLPKRGSRGQSRRRSGDLRSFRLVEDETQ